MARKASKELLVGLDIGTSKIVAIVGEIAEDGGLEIVGVGTHPSRGMSRGVVVNIEQTTQAIRKAVEEAELMSGCRVQSVYAGISGKHVRAHNSKGIVAIKNREVSEYDKERVIDAARALPIPNDQKVLHVIPQEWSVDDEEGIREPVGMFGVRLEGQVHIVSVSDAAAKNIYKCVERCGLHVDRLILEPLASSYAVLTPDELELGVCMVDIGHGTSDIAIFKDGSIRHNAVVPVAGEVVTRDIAFMFRTPMQAAERIKVEHGCALESEARDQRIQVPSAGDHPPREIGSSELAAVIEARYRELFRDLIQRELHKSGYWDQIAGVVLTGGSARIPGVVHLAEEVFNVPVRLGTPQNVQGMTEIASNPAYATAVGLLLFGREASRALGGDDGGGGFKAAWERIRSWFAGNF